MVFDDYFFIAISDLSMAEDVQAPIQFKSIVFKDFIIVISFEVVYCVEQLFSKILNFAGFPEPASNPEFPLFSDQ